jgi:glycosyltransferase involved in cell wall biosynthesis
MNQPGGVQLSVIIPVFNAQASLRELWARTAAALDERAIAFEVVFVDDGSGDGSLAVLEGLAGADGRARVLQHAGNRGQGEAVSTGLEQARGGTIVTMDDDLQHRPEDIPALLRHASAGTLAMGVPSRRPRPWWRELGTLAVNAVSNALLDKPLPLRPTAFCAFERALGERALRGGGRVAWIAALADAATRVAPVIVVMDASRLGGSRYTLGKLIVVSRRRLRLFARARARAVMAGALATASVTFVALAAGTRLHPLPAAALGLAGGAALIVLIGLARSVR